MDDTMATRGRINGGWALNLSTVDYVDPYADCAVLASGTTSNNLGDLLTYQLIVTNIGPDALSNIVLTNVLPGGAAGQPLCRSPIARVPAAISAAGSFANWVPSPTRDTPLSPSPLSPKISRHSLKLCACQRFRVGSQSL